MPKKTDRLTVLPAGLLPLLSQPQLETYYGVSDWTVLQWIKQGMPVRPFVGRQKRFDLTEVEAWMAEQDPEFIASDEAAPQLVAASA
ncbi:helix-turn-helix domain-containing protein [Streptomyces sp. NPDC057699]|uniref:helix-turn-helix domain-containing protein n=1 Tax=Streptomyces sp. NPDC057699 TaxID=3346220 RepID=UPI0036CA1345